MRKLKIEKRVGYLGIDDSDPDNLRFYYELDYGANCYGNVDLFYLDPTEVKRGGGICYIRTVPNGVIYSDDPHFKEYAYTFDDCIRICKGNEDAADCALEVAGGYGMEVAWDCIKSSFKPYPDTQDNF